MYDCLVVGDANVDLLVEGVVALEIGTETLASNLNLALGGPSAITAFNLSKLGVSVSLAGIIGQDLFGRFVEEKLTSGGANLSGLHRTPKENTGVTIWHSINGAWGTTGTTEFAVPAIPTKVVDTTGAGDSFNAGFLAEFIKGKPLQACAKAGVLAGSRNVQEVGGTAAFEK